MNSYNFTERCRKILELARMTSFRLHHEYVGTEHILLGLIEEGEGVGSAVLHSLGVDFDELKVRIESIVQVGRVGKPTGQDLPYTSRAKRVLELSMTAARELQHSYVGSEHLLIGLLAEERGIAAQVLTELGATLSRVRDETLRLLGTEMPPASRFSSALHAGRLEAPSHFGQHIAAIAIEIRLKDGSSVRQSFGDVLAAIRFLSDDGGAAVRRKDSE